MGTLTTPVQAWPYPAESDSPDVAADLHALALALDVVPKRLSGVASARPVASATPVDTIYYATDTGVYSICTGAAWGTMLIVDSTGKSQALQLTSNQQLQVVVGTVNIVWPGGSNISSNSTFTHSIGRAPTGISVLPVNTIGGAVVPFVNGATSSTVIIAAAAVTGTPGAGSQPAYITVIG